MVLRQFMREVDKDKDGYINLEEFKKAVGWEQTEGEGNIGMYNGVPLPPPPKDVSHQHKVSRVAAAIIIDISFRHFRVPHVLFRSITACHPRTSSRRY